jgi:anti-anti-sigma factor
MRDEPFPVAWMGRLAVVAFPDHVDISNVGQLRDRLLSVINRGPAVLIADMTLTESCGHAAVEALARACQRAAVSGTQVRLAVFAPVVRRVLSIEGLDRLVSIYPSVEAAIAAGQAAPAGHATAADLTAAAAGQARAALSQHAPVTAGLTAADFPASRTVTPAVLWQLLDALGDGLLLTGQDGKIALVNRRCAEMFGYQREELIGMPVDSLVPADLRGAHERYRTGYHQVPQPRAMADRSRLVGLLKDGATLPVEISLSPLPTASEDLILAVIRDATEPRWQPDLTDLARNVAADQGTKDLLDRVVQRLFQVGLSLQAASVLPGDMARRGLAYALDQLDDVIVEVRNYAFGYPAPLATGWPASCAATRVRKVRMVAAATRCRTVRSSVWPSGPNGGRYAPSSRSTVPSPSGASVRSASSTGNRPPPAPVASHRSARPADLSVHDSSRACTRTSLAIPATPTRVRPGP